MTRDLFKFLFFVLGVLALALGVLRYFFVDVYVISGVGMAPTLMPGEQVFAWREAEIEQGDIVICDQPDQPGGLVVGRVLALPGQTISVERGTLSVNRRRVDTDIQGNANFTNPLTDITEPVVLVEETLDMDQQHLYMEAPRGELRFRTTTLAPGMLFLLGDNRLTNAEDSRAFGPVARDTCRAQLVMRNGAVEGAPGPSHGYFDILK